MFDSLFKSCAICNKKQLQFSMIKKADVELYVCKKCINTFQYYNGYNFNTIQNYSIEEIKKSIQNKKSIRDLEFEKKLKEHQENRKKMKDSNNNVYQTCFSNLKYLKPNLSENKEPKKLLKDMPELKFSNITSRTSLDTINTFIVIDTETTGLSASTDELLEISAIKFIDSEPKDCLTTLLKPKKPITKEIESINHITNEMVQNSPSVEYVINDFSNFIKGFNIVGYNLEFDIKFLHRNGMDLFTDKRKFYDVLPMCRRTLKDDFITNYKLDTVCSHLGIQRSNAHRATEDALATGILFRDIGQSKKLNI